MKPGLAAKAKERMHKAIGYFRQRIGRREILILLASFLTFVFAWYAVRRRPAFGGKTDIAIYCALYLCCLFVLAMSFRAFYVKKWPVHKAALVAVGAIGLLSFIINTPGSAPDEIVHIQNTYLWSNRIMGVPSTLSDRQKGVYTDYDTYVRKEDAGVINDIVQKNSTVANYERTIRDFRLFASPDDAKLVGYGLRDNGVSPVSYFPAIIGVTIARLLRLGGVPMLYLAKLSMLAFYVFGFYWAIKRIPLGKYAIFIISILPMSFFLAPSFSYDSVIIALSMMLVAQVMHLAYGPVQKIGAADAVLSGALVLLLSPMKAYLPLALLFFIIPQSKFATRARYFAFCFCMLLVGIVSAALGNLPIILNFKADSTYVNQAISANHPAYTFSWLLRHPLQTAYILINTSVTNAYWYFTMMMGGSLGWLNIGVSGWIIFGLAFCLAASCIKEEGEDNPIKRKDRALLGSAALLVYLVFLLGMMLWWTRAGDKIISGIQGRYFIPLLPLVIFAFHGLNKRLKVKKGFGQGVCMGAIVLTLCSFANIMTVILSR